MDFYTAFPHYQHLGSPSHINVAEENPAAVFSMDLGESARGKEDSYPSSMMLVKRADWDAKNEEISLLKSQINYFHTQMVEFENKVDIEKNNTLDEILEKLKWKGKAFDYGNHLVSAQEKLVKCERKLKEKEGIEKESRRVANKLVRVVAELELRNENYEKEIQDLKTLRLTYNEKLASDLQEKVNGLTVDLKQKKSCLQDALSKVESLEQELRATKRKLESERNSRKEVETKWEHVANVFLDRTSLQLKPVEVVLPALQKLLAPIPDKMSRNGNGGKRVRFSDETSTSASAALDTSNLKDNSEEHLKKGRSLSEINGPDCVRPPSRGSLKRKISDGDDPEVFRASKMPMTTATVVAADEKTEVRCNVQINCAEPNQVQPPGSRSSLSNDESDQIGLVNASSVGTV